MEYKFQYPVIFQGKFQLKSMALYPGKGTNTRVFFFLFRFRITCGEEKFYFYTETSSFEIRPIKWKWAAVNE